MHHLINEILNGPARYSVSITLDRYGHWPLYWVFCWLNLSLYTLLAIGICKSHTKHSSITGWILRDFLGLVKI